MAYESTIIPLLLIESGSLFVAAVTVFLLYRHNRKLQQDCDQYARMLAQKSKLEIAGQMTAGIVHDFNHVLTSIDSYIRIAEKNMAIRNSALVSHLNNMTRALSRGRALSEKLLDLAGRDKGDSEMIFDIGRFVQTQEALLESLLPPGVDLRVNVQDEGWVSGSAEDMAQILFNLVINARDALKTGGKIEVTAAIVEKMAGRFACLRVADTGCGMTPDVVARMFEPFFTTKADGGGTGLGLAIIRDMVNGMKGEIEIQSAPNEGTIISVLFPACRRPAESPPVVLLAESSYTQRRRMGDLLRGSGCEVIEAASAAEALLHQDEYRGKIDVLLCNPQLPGVEGKRLSMLIKAERPDIAIAFISAQEMKFSSGHPVLDSRADDENFLGSFRQIIAESHRTRAQALHTAALAVVKH